MAMVKIGAPEKAYVVCEDDGTRTLMVDSMDDLEFVPDKNPEEGGGDAG